MKLYFAPRNTLTLFLLASILLCFGAPARAGEEGQVTFEGRPGALAVNIQPGKSGDALLETGYSDPRGAYDTIMLHGEMPGELALQVCVQDGASAEGCVPHAPSKVKIFSNGRFWAKFSLGQTTGQPFKFIAREAGASAAGTLIVYDIEAFLDAGQPQDRPLPAAAIQAPAPSPFPLVTRGQWGAAPPTSAYTPHQPRMITLHHTAGKFTRTLEESKAEALFDQDYHQNKKGWNDIGYHFLIDPLGNIFEGRPVTVVGSHAENRNSDNVGITLMGYYHPPVSNQPTAAALEAFVKIGRYLRDNYGVLPTAFYGHRDLKATACPGDSLYSRKQELSALIFEAP
jgi:hypothetical protein